jgi:hypothetical protein
MSVYGLVVCGKDGMKRLRSCARRCSELVEEWWQAAWVSWRLGFPGTIGKELVDYFIAIREGRGARARGRNPHGR